MAIVRRKKIFSLYFGPHYCTLVYFPYTIVSGVTRPFIQGITQEIRTNGSKVTVTSYFHCIIQGAPTFF